MLLIWKSESFSTPYAEKTCKIIAQANEKTSIEEKLYANDVALTYVFSKGFDKRIVNGVKANWHTSIRFTGKPNTYYSSYTCLYHYY